MMSPGALLHLAALSAVLTMRRLLSAAGAPTGTQAQLTALSTTPDGGGSAGGGAPGADAEMQLCAQYPGGSPGGIVTVMAKGFDSPGASVIGATQVNGSAPGTGMHPSGGTIAVIGAGIAAPAPMNAASESCTLPLNGWPPVLVIVTPKVQ